MRKLRDDIQTRLSCNDIIQDALLEHFRDIKVACSQTDLKAAFFDESSSGDQIWREFQFYITGVCSLESHGVVSCTDKTDLGSGRTS
jgi:hypothetical protein